MAEALKEREPIPCEAPTLALVRRSELDDWFDVGVGRGAEHLLVLEGLQGAPVEPLYVYSQDWVDRAPLDHRVHLPPAPALELVGSWRNRTVLAVLLLRSGSKELQLDRVQVQAPFSLHIPVGIPCPVLPKGVQLLAGVRRCPTCGR